MCVHSSENVCLLNLVDIPLQHTSKCPVFNGYFNPKKMKLCFDKRNLILLTNHFSALLFALLILVLALLVIYGSNRYYMRYKRSRQSTSETNLEAEEEKPKTAKPRLRSLDTFRGYKRPCIVEQ